MPFLLDTNIVSYILKSPHGDVAERFRRTPSGQTFLSSVVEAELRFGTQSMPPGARAPFALEEFLVSTTVLPWDSDCARRHAALRNLLRQDPLSWSDSMIAAHALTLDYTLVTHDDAFTRVPDLRLQDWTKGPRLL